LRLAGEDIVSQMPSFWCTYSRTHRYRFSHCTIISHPPEDSYLACDSLYPLQLAVEVLGEAQQYSEAARLKLSSASATTQPISALIEKWQEVLEHQRPPTLYGSVKVQATIN